LPKIPKGKKVLYAYIDEVLYSKFRDFIIKSYSKNVHGALSSEVERVVRNHLKLEQHTKTHVPNPTLPRSHQYAKEIINQLKDQGFYEQCTVNDVYRAIDNVRGNDPRTRKKWLAFLLDNNYLKWTNNRVLKIIHSTSQYC